MTHLPFRWKLVGSASSPDLAADTLRLHRKPRDLDLLLTVTVCVTDTPWAQAQPRSDRIIAEPPLLSNFRAIPYLDIFKGSSFLLLPEYVTAKEGNVHLNHSPADPPDGAILQNPEREAQHGLQSGGEERGPASQGDSTLLSLAMSLCKGHQKWGQCRLSPRPHVPVSPGPQFRHPCQPPKVTDGSK